MSTHIGLTEKMLTVTFVGCKSGLFMNFGILFFSVTNSQSVRCKGHRLSDWAAIKPSSPLPTPCHCLSAVQCQCVHWGRRDGASNDANYPIVTVRSTPPPPLSQGCPYAPLTAGLVAQYARVTWLDSALRRLCSTWKACDRNHTLPCNNRDFDCDRSWPKLFDLRLRFDDRPNTKV